MSWALVENGSYVRPISLSSKIPTGTGAFRVIRDSIRTDAEADDPTALATLRDWGVYPVVHNSRPEDTPTDTYDESWQVVGDEVVQTWTQRPKTQNELDAEAFEVTQEGRKTVFEATSDAANARADEFDALITTAGNWVTQWTTAPWNATINDPAGAYAFCNEIRDQWVALVTFLRDDELPTTADHLRAFADLVDYIGRRAGS